jgi:protein-disulfide isomerase
MNKVFIAILAVVFMGFMGLVLWSVSNNQGVDYTAYDSSKVIAPTVDNGEIADHVSGNPDSPVIIVEWGDFSCSHCASYNPMFKQISSDYGDRIAWVYRNFPLNGYPNSLSAASAVEAAGFQGYYWEMSDAMFSNQALWASASEASRTDLYLEIFQRAVPAGDTARLRTDMASRSIAKKIDFDKNLGKLKDIQGTPALYCNGESIDGSVFGDDTKFRQFIDAKLTEFGL